MKIQLTLTRENTINEINIKQFIGIHHLEKTKEQAIHPKKKLRILLWINYHP